MAKTPSRFLGQRGQVMPIVGISLIVLLTFAGVLVDVGHARYEQRLAQVTVDSAAISGANAFAYTTGSGIKTAALRDVVTNGFQINDVTIHTPPISGPNVANTSAVEADLKTTVPTTFGRFVHINSLPIYARAVAMGAPTLPCLTILNAGAYAGNQALTINGGAQLNLPNCAINDNGGLLVNGSATASDFGSPPTFVNAQKYNYTGAISNPQQVLWTTRGYAPATKSGSIADPCTTNVVCKAFPPCTGTPGGNQTVKTSLLGGAAVPAGCYTSGMNVSYDGDQTKIAPGSALFCGTYWITGSLTSYVSDLKTCPGGATFYVGGSVNLDALTIEMTNVPNQPLFYVQTGDFTLNQNLVNAYVTDSFTGMIYVPLGSFVFVDGTVNFQSIDAGSVVFNTGNSWGGNTMKVGNTISSGTSTKLAE